MSKYCISGVVENLTEAEKNRLLYCFLSSDNPTSMVADWGLATEALGSASVGSMKVMVSSTLRKIEKAALNGDTPPAKSKKRPSKANSKTTNSDGKGGVKPKSEADGDGDAEDLEMPPKKQLKSEPEDGTGQL